MVLERRNFHHSARLPAQEGGLNRGAVMVETALYLLPFLAILFGILDFGVSIWIKNTLQHAVREGTRLGVDIGLFNGPGWSEAGGA